MSWPWGTYLGEEAMRSGIRTKISSWQRIPAERRPARLEGDRRLPELDARGDRGAAGRVRRGDPAHARRHVADGPGETIFVVRGGMISTPDLSTGILHGITRDSVITDRRATSATRCSRRRLIRSDLYLADEVFMCGTAAEVTPVRSVDDHEIGVGRVTRRSRRRTSTPSAARATRFAQWRELVPSMTRSRLA